MKKFLTFLFIMSLVSLGFAYTIVGNSVVYEDSSAKLTVTPHTTTSPVKDFRQKFEVQNKTGVSADIYLAYVFPEPLINGEAWLYTQTSFDRFDWIEEQYTCEHDFNYILNQDSDRNPHYFWCFTADTNGTTIHMEHEFQSGDGDTAVWEEIGQTSKEEWEWIDRSDYFMHIEDGGKHYYTTTAPVRFLPYETREWLIRYKPSASGDFGEWDLIAWSGASWGCILEGTCDKVWIIDPWWDSDYIYKRKVTVTAVVDLNAGFPIDLNILDINFSACIEAGKCNNDLSDVRLVNAAETTELSYMLEAWEPLDANRMFWSLLTDLAALASRDFYVFHGKPTATAITYDMDLNAPGWDYNYSGTSEAILAYHFENNTNDSTKNNYDGVNNGVTFLCDKNALFQCAGTFVRSESDYVDSSTTFQSFVGDITIFTCFVNNGIVGSQDSIMTYDSGSDVFRFYMIPGASPTFRVGLKTGGGWRFFHDSLPLTKYQRNCVSFSLGSAGVKVFMNGLQVYSNASTYDIGNMGAAARGKKVYIGATNSGSDGIDPNSYFAGQMDEFRILDYQITTPGQFYRTFNSAYNVTEMFDMVVAAEEMLNTDPDVNITEIDGVSDISLNDVFAYIADGNLTISFDVMDAENNSLLIDMNFSSVNTEGTGTVLFKDVNTMDITCDDSDFSDSTGCSLDFNIHSSLIPSDGNYFILIKVFDDVASDFNASDSSFLIDNTPPVLDSYYPTIDVEVFVSSVTFLIEASDVNREPETVFYGIYLNNILDSNSTEDFNSDGAATITYPFLLVGEHVFLVINKITDDLGNENLSIQATGDFVRHLTEEEAFLEDVETTTDEEIIDAGTFLFFNMFAGVGAYIVTFMFVILAVILVLVLFSIKRHN